MLVRRRSWKWPVIGPCPAEVLDGDDFYRWGPDGSGWHALASTEGVTVSACFRQGRQLVHLGNGRRLGGGAVQLASVIGDEDGVKDNWVVTVLSL